MCDLPHVAQRSTLGCWGGSVRTRSKGCDASGSRRQFLFGPIRNLVVISIGTGVGAGIIIDGHILRGATGAAGEIAYLPLGADPTTPNARRRGSLEIAVGGPAMARALREHRAQGTMATRLGADASPEAIFRAAADGDELGILWLRRRRSSPSGSS